MQVSSPQDKLTLALDIAEPLLIYEIEAVLLSKDSFTMEDNPNFFGYRRVIGVKDIFVENWKQTKIEINLATGNLTHNDGFESSILDLGALELMNFHQWSGVPPFKMIAMLKGSKPSQGLINNAGEEPPLWEIVAVDSATGERRVFLRSHCNKDHIFTVLNRITALMDYARNVCKPWNDILYNQGTISPDEIQEQIADFPPRFRFTELPKSGENGAPYYL